MRKNVLFVILTMCCLVSLGENLLKNADFSQRAKLDSQSTGRLELKNGSNKF